MTLDPVLWFYGTFYIKAGAHCLAEDTAHIMVAEKCREEGPESFQSHAPVTSFTPLLPKCSTS